MNPSDIRMYLPATRVKALGYVIGKPVGASLPAGYTHPYALDIDACPYQECWICGTKACPEHEPLHFHHDGCPCCDMPGGVRYDSNRTEEVRLAYEAIKEHYRK